MAKFRFVANFRFLTLPKVGKEKKKDSILCHKIKPRWKVNFSFFKIYIYVLAKYQADDEEKSDHSNEIIGVVVGCIGAFVAIATVVAIVVVKKRVSVPQATLSFDNPVMEMQESKVVETPEGINHV